MRARRRGGVSAVSAVMGPQLDGMQIARRIQEHTAPLIWAGVVGPQVAGATEVLGVEGGVLRVSTKSAVWANELTFYKADILRRLNRRLGADAEPVIRDILFLGRGLRRPEEPDAKPEVAVGAMELSVREMATIESAVAPVAEETLRSRMRKARIAEAQLRTWRLDHGWVPCLRCGDLAPPREQGGASCPRCRIFGRK